MATDDYNNKVIAEKANPAMLSELVDDEDEARHTLSVELDDPIFASRSHDTNFGKANQGAPGKHQRQNSRCCTAL